jgi:RhtB (resistance to homoserine/threonine) family protein
MFDSQLAAFTVVAAILTVTPGADTLLVIRNVLIGSRQQGVATTFGICSGLFIHALFSAMGVSLLLLHSAELFRTVKIMGACYLIWLGWQSMQSAIQHHGFVAIDKRQGPESRTLRKCFVEGFLTNLLNPKVAIFYLAFLPQFIQPGDPVISKSILLTAIHYAMSIVWLVFICFLLDFSRGMIVNSYLKNWLDGICGVILIGLGFKLIAEKY